MSTDNIQAFQAKVQSSAELQARVAEIQRQVSASTAEALSRLATEAGTPFTPAEFLAPFQTDAELSEEELAGVAGGVKKQDPTIVSRQELEGNVWNCWNLFGKQYGYTTADGNIYLRSAEMNIGDSIHGKKN